MKSGWDCWAKMSPIGWKAMALIQCLLIHLHLYHASLFVVVVVQLLNPFHLFSNTLDCSLSGSSVYRISQARILKWVVIFFSRGSSQPRDWPGYPTLQVDSLLTETPRKPKEDVACVCVCVCVCLCVCVNITHTQYGILLSKEWNNAICSNMDGPRDYHTKWSKSDTKRKYRMTSHICGI